MDNNPGKHQPPSRLITSEMMQAGVIPLLFTGGACNIQCLHGSVRNPGRDPLARWLDKKGWSYFDPQIHPDTHGRQYVPDIDGPQEKRARETAKLRVYEFTSTTIASITAMEVMDDARLQRTSIIWFNGGHVFNPIGIGSCDESKHNHTLLNKADQAVYAHLLAYVNAGNQLRSELLLMLADCPYSIFINSFDELQTAISQLLKRSGIE